MPTIVQLNQRHPSWNGERYDRLCSLYEGGDRFQRCLPNLLLQREFEDSKRYAIRQKEAVYRNYLGPIIDYFAALLFASKIVATAKRDDTVAPDPGDYYATFRDDCDRGGTDIEAFFKHTTTQAMIGGQSWVRLNAPSTPTDQAPKTKAEHDRQGLGDVWLSHVDCCEVFDWEPDEFGNLAWALVHRSTMRRAGISGDRNTVTHTWEYLTVDAVEKYEITYRIDQPPAPETEVPRVSATPHPFRRVPLVCLELPVGLWIANRIESPQLAHFRLTNAQTWGMATSCYAMAVFHVEKDDEGNPRMPVMGAGRGIMLGIEEKMGWAAPPGAPFDELRQEIGSHKDEIFRIAHQMALGVENNAAAVGRSAMSKASDAEATRTVLIAYSRLVKRVVEIIYDMISAARGDDFQWNTAGLDDFAAKDLDGLVDVLVKVGGVGGIPSPTFNKELKTRIADSFLPDLDQAVKQKIKDEIHEGVDNPPPDEDELAMTKLHALAKKMAAADGGATDPKAPAGAGSSGSIPPGAPDAEEPHKIADTAGASAKIAEEVYAQLLEDFPKEAIAWVRAATWTGPTEVPLDSIDFSSRATWRASKEPKQVAKFADMMKAGEAKPIVLVNEPNNAKMIVVDGHHRALAAEKNGTPVLAYVAHVGTADGPWDSMHASQRTGRSKAA